MPEQSQSFNTWAIVEVMGHKKFAGFVTEQTFGAATMIRVDVPATEQPDGRTTAEYSKLIGVGSIYMLTPCTEEVARKAAVVIERWNDPIPVSIPAERQLSAVSGARTEDVEFVHDDFDDDE